MSRIDHLVEILIQATPRQLQMLLANMNTVDGSKIRAARNARTEKYFSAAPKPHHCLTFGVYKDTVDYMAEIGTDAWLSQSVNHQTKNATIVRVRKA